MKTKFVSILLSALFSGFTLFLVSPAAVQAQERIPNDTVADCNIASGQCFSGQANCPGLQYDMIGYCNAGQTDSCCKLKTQATGPGTDYYCTTSLSGNCQQASRGCGANATNVGACSTDAAGTTRVCCRNNPPTTTTTTTGVGSVTGSVMSDYTLLEQVPGSSNTTGRLNTYLEDIYRFAFWTVGIAVVFMLTIGGFMYLTSAGNTSRMESAKTVIFDAILGLVLALVAWLFLYVVNPDLVNVRLPSASITPLTPQAPVTTTTVSGGSTQTLAQQLRAGSPGVTISGSGSCSSASGVVSPASNIAQAAASEPVTACQAGCPGSGLCSGSTGLSDAMLRGLINVGARYPITISSFAGGSHGGGSSHYAGRAVDVVPSAPKAQWPEVQAAFRGQGATLVICDIWDAATSRNISIPCNDARADHIHAAW